jgi:hypothetical protein
MSSKPFGDYDEVWADSVVCRIIHVILARVRPDVHCMHVRPTGGGKCVDEPYNQGYFDDEALFGQPRGQTFICPDTDDFLVLFAPCIDQADLGSWLVANAGEFPASDLRNTLLEHRCGLIREPSLYGAPYILQDFGVDDTIRALALPKRRDFLYYGYPDRQEQDESGAGFKERKIRMLPVLLSTVDKLSLDFVECSLLIPSILYQLWRRLLALDLSSSLLKDVAFYNVEYIITATNAPSSNETTNYQQLELFGDSVLKFLVSIHLYHAHRLWPEGYLSRAKDQIVAISRLYRVGVEAKLDRYIVSEPFTANKWPQHMSRVIPSQLLRGSVRFQPRSL